MFGVGFACYWTWWIHWISIQESGVATILSRNPSSHDDEDGAAADDHRRIYETSKGCRSSRIDDRGERRFHLVHRGLDEEHNS